MSQLARNDRSLISIIIPVYNEEQNVRIAYEAVKSLFDGLADRYHLELFFSDNHSTDGTFAELKRIAAHDPAVRVIRLARNFGFQRSVLTAYRHVHGAAAIQIDCDLQDPPEIILEFLKKWEAGHDVVVGIRRTREENSLFQFMRWSFYRLVRLISDENIVDDAGDFRLVDRSVIERLRQVRDSRPYTRGLISSLSARQTGVIYDRAARRFGKSKFPFRKLFGLATDGIINHSLVPLRLASFIGLLVFFSAVIFVIYYVINYMIAGQAWPEGFATTTILLLFSLGLNAILLGILGEYVGRIYDEVRVRPLSVIEQSINFEAETERDNLEAGTRQK